MREREREREREEGVICIRKGELEERGEEASEAGRRKRRRERAKTLKREGIKREVFFCCLVFSLQSHLYCRERLCFRSKLSN